ncbi:hypothetical protein HHX47_DHR5000001 [Lentinula edodes]|nr:hypothetical protein HHX47_DHR5000001 [Lentinula edodes]
MENERAYRGMDTYNPKTANVQYLFLPTDHTSLYRKASQELGVDVRLQPQYNVDDWLNPESHNFKPDIAEAVFHYSARTEAGDRFEICLSTPEMDNCAHKYAHHSQLVLDGTFGVCSSLVATVDHTVATALLENHKVFLNNLATNPEAKRACEAGLDHIRYLQDYWMARPLWESWSECGRIAAAARIGVAVEGIIPTTNHLESFNAVLKRKYIQRYLRSGHRLRFDILILLLITQILPQIFRRRNAQRQYHTWLTSRFHASSGGQDLLLVQQKHHDDQKEYTRQLRSVCWWPMDEVRHGYACELLRRQSLHSITVQSNPDGLAYIAHCNPSSGGPTPYLISLHTSGCASCTCLDFYHNGKACKHLHALRILIDDGVKQGHIVANFHYPSSLEDAQALCQNAHKTSPPFPIHVPSEDLNPGNSFSATSWMVVQAIGQDTTLLGTAFDEEIKDNLNKDLEPASFVRGSDGGSSDGGSLDEWLAEDFSHPMLSQQEGVSLQITHRLNQEAQALLPRLYGIENALSDLQTLPSSSELLEFEQVMEKLSAQLTRLRSSRDPYLPEATPSFERAQDMSVALTAVNDLPSNRKRKRVPERALRAPSPEAKQTRKSSNGTL